MPLVPAKCPECGGLVEVDKEKRAGLCQHCGQPFVVEDAIQTFNTYYQTTNYYNTTHNYSDGTVVNVYEDKSKDFVIEAGVLKEYHGESVDVVLPENIKSIDLECFTEKDGACVKGKPIETICIGTNDIDPNSLYSALKHCGNLKLVEVNTENNNYTSENGVLYNKDKTSIIFIPKAYPRDNLTIKVSILKISDNIKSELYRFNHLYYDDIDFMNLHCQDTRAIELAKQKNLPYKITKHSFVDNICKSCNELNVLNQFNNKYFRIGIMEKDSLYLYSWFGSETSSLEDELLLKNVNALTCKTLFLGDLGESFAKVSSFISKFVNVERIVWVKDTSRWDDWLNERVILTDRFIIELEKLREVLFFESVTRLPVFRNCTALEKVILPNSLKYIGANTFLNCYNLENLHLPSTLEGIGENAFKGCNKLINMTIPNNLLNKIQSDAYRMRNSNLLKGIFYGKGAFSEVWKHNNKCQHCGGEFKYPLFGSIKCQNCGKPKDY